MSDNAFAPPRPEDPLAIEMEGAPSFGGALQAGTRLWRDSWLSVGVVVVGVEVLRIALALFFPIELPNIVWNVLSSICSSAYAGAMLGYMQRRFEGRPTGIREVSRDAIRYAFPIWIAWLVPSVGMMLGFLFVIVPGIWLAARFSLITPAVVYGSGGPTTSWRLSVGHEWPLLGFWAGYTLLFVGATGAAAVGMYTFVERPEWFEPLAFGVGPFEILVAVIAVVSAFFMTLPTAWFGAYYRMLMRMKVSSDA